jgi:hypothetical protein
MAIGKLIKNGSNVPNKIENSFRRNRTRQRRPNKKEYNVEQPHWERPVKNTLSFDRNPSRL